VQAASLAARRARCSSDPAPASWRRSAEEALRILLVRDVGLLSIFVCLARFSPKRLRPLGWAIVGSSAVTLVILVAGLR
jgi:hypothetical protein